MMSETVAVQEHLFDSTTQITETIDFGTGMEDVRSGRTTMPPQGLRFNLRIEGELTGAKVKGKISGTNYLYVRADGVGFIDAHFIVITPEGDRIAMHAQGISTPPEGSTVSQFRENESFFTASTKYAWINRIQVWATGSVDLETGKLTAKGYIA
ncbi:MAG: DUF3237 family protein [Spirochaetia bacterium]|jgi:hypothetical protein